jgi:ribosomal protein S12 methylthiotransferase
MRRPANEAKVLERIRGWREICPDIAIRSSFVVGFPGETEEDFGICSTGWTKRSSTASAPFASSPSRAPPPTTCPSRPEEVKEERYARIMEKTAAISAAKLQAKIGRTIDVIIDVADGEGGATGRSTADAPEIDGEVHLRGAARLKQGDIVRVLVEDADEHDLYGVPAGG